MAFEAVIAHETTKPSLRKRLMITTSILLHAGALVVGVVHSFWYVEELSPPQLAITLHLGALPPPPPPPPARKANAAPKPRPAVNPNRIVQPKEVPTTGAKAPAAEAQGEDDGDPNGVVGGVGAVAAPPPPPPPPKPPEPPKMLPPQIGRQQLLIDPNDDAYKVKVPPALRGQDLQFVAILKVCVSPQGTVTSVQVVRPADPLIDAQFPSVIGRWRYRPYTSDGEPRPFCYHVRYDLSTR